MKKCLGIIGLIICVGLVASENSENRRARTSDVGGRVRHARKASVSQGRKSNWQNSQREDNQKENIQESGIRSQESISPLKIQEKVPVIPIVNKSSRSVDEIIEEFNT